MVATSEGRQAGWSLVLLVFSASFACAPLEATEPTIRNLNVRGLQVGGTTTVIVDGDDLTLSPRLLLPFPATQTLKPGATDKQATFEVTLGDEVQPGYGHLRVVTDGGVSLPEAIGVDRLAQRTLAATLDQLPVALHGVVNGSAVVETSFPGKAGQKVLVEVEARRLGSKLRPVVHLYNSKRRQLAWAWTTPTLGGDTRLEATLPENGSYTIAVHDVEYAAPAPGFFRLKIGQWAFVDQVFPPVTGTGQQAAELLGPSLPLRVDFSVPRSAIVQPLAWPGEGLWSGPRPFVLVSSQNEIVGAGSAGKAQELPRGPVGVSGRLTQPFAEDLYRVPVQPGSKIRFEVFAERYGSPLDVAVVVRNETGGELARVEDGPGTLDPVLDYTVPDKITAVLVAVVDAQGRGGPRGVYRLTVEPQLAGAAKKDFRLFTPALRVALPVGGSSVVPVLVERRGYQGSVEVSAEGLPAGVRMEGAAIPAGADGALVTLRRTGVPGNATISSWRGHAEEGEVQPVVVRGDPLERVQPWLGTELAVAPAASTAADFQVDWRGLSQEAWLVPAGKLVLPVKLTRPASDSVVRLGLVTSQLTPFVNNQPDPNLALRQEKPVELAAKVLEGEVTVLVPPQLTAALYDLTIQAELLAPDKKTVLATSFAPVRRLPVRMLLLVEVEGAERIETTIDPKAGASFEVKGNVERREGLTGDVTVSLAGLPAGGKADPVTVKAGMTEFSLRVILPANVPVGEIQGVKLSATGTRDAKLPNLRVKSRDVELTLVLNASR
jgi:hypothetical protein